MRRRSLLAGGASALLFPGRSWGTPPDELAFRVMRHGAQIGTHRITFARNANHVIAHIQVEMHLEFGPLTLFRYRHEAYEVWEKERFFSLTSTTNHNGTSYRVDARRVADGIDANGSVLPMATIPFTHWNQAITIAPLFDPERGTPAPETVTARGETVVALADGREVSARRFDFAGQATISDWYDPGGNWIALTALAPDGSEIRYERS